MGVRTAAVKKEEVSKTVRAIGYVAHNVDLYKIQNEFIDAYRKYVTVYRDYRRYDTRRRNWDVYRELQTKFLEAEHELTLLGLGEADIAKLRDIKWWKSWDQPELAILRESNNYWIVAQVFERDLGFVEVGQKAKIMIPSFHEEMTGIIRSVGGRVDPETRTVRALIEITDYRGELKADMLAYIDISSELGDHLVVPSGAVMDLGTRRIVFVDRGQGVFDPVEVRVAFQGDDYWAIDQGLIEGDRIVVDGNFLLDSESRMKAHMTQNSGVQAHEVGHGQS
jgi:multidrug efflux pump subunit AcrA (membrane-fusion protein)